MCRSRLSQDCLRDDHPEWQVLQTSYWAAAIHLRTREYFWLREFGWLSQYEGRSPTVDAEMKAGT